MSSKDKQLSIIDHLTEFRRRLTIIAIVNLVAALLCYQYVDIIVKYILELSKGMNLVYIAPSELFIVYVKLALTCGVIISSPITLLQIWLFICKGLYKKEKIYIILSLILGIIFFAGGVVFCYEVVLPITINFFINIQVPGIKSMVSVDAFVSFISTMLLCFGAVFEMPIVVLLLSMVGLVKPDFLLKKQPVFIIILFVVAAFITPPDVVSQMFLGIPMVLLFELSIGISWLVDKIKTNKRKKLESI
ncbi:twin-arginine translocase subunit TatC [Clostridium sp.]|uniref:twin-arginine translocase subunit TatC n=1 Tax=Clostridium sp. TaxID=1506 RepID=UPI003F3EB303